MCDLCGNERDREIGRQRMFRVAEMMERLSMQYRAMGHGHIKPHTDEAAAVARLALCLVKELVDEWV